MTGLKIFAWHPARSSSKVAARFALDLFGQNYFVDLVLFRILQVGFHRAGQFMCQNRTLLLFKRQIVTIDDLDFQFGNGLATKTFELACHDDIFTREEMSFADGCFNFVGIFEFWISRTGMKLAGGEAKKSKRRKNDDFGEIQGIGFHFCWYV